MQWSHPARSAQSNREVRLQVVTKTFHLPYFGKNITSSQNLGICPCFLSFSHSVYPIHYQVLFTLLSLMSPVFLFHPDFYNLHFYFLYFYHSNDLSPSSLLIGPLASIAVFLQFILQNKLQMQIHRITLLPTVGSHYNQDGTYRIWPATVQMASLKK